MGCCSKGRWKGFQLPLLTMFVIVWSETAADHIWNVQRVLKCLGQAGLRFHPDKPSSWQKGWNTWGM
jgi:hypothetical protein